MNRDRDGTPVTAGSPGSAGTGPPRWLRRGGRASRCQHRRGRRSGRRCRRWHEGRSGRRRCAFDLGRVAISAVAGLALASLAACGPDGPDGPAAAVPTADTVEPVVDREAAVAAAVDIRADGCGPRVGFGTGSVIDDGVVVTAAHVVAGATAVEMIAVDGARSPGEVVLFDPDLDLAVIRAATPVGTPLAPRALEAAAGEAGLLVLPREVGGEVTVDVADVRVVRPANIRTTDVYLDRPVERAGFEVEGSIDLGDSGAMVVLPGGGAGIVWARSNRDQRRAWAIDLPDAVLNGDVAELTTPVDVGPCIR